MDQAQAMKKREQEGWSVTEDAGRGWRRVVPSPRPKQVTEEGPTKNRIDDGTCVITVGGDGIPVVADQKGNCLVWRP